MTVHILQLISLIGIVVLAGLVFLPYFSAENRAKRRKAFVESIASQMSLWNRRFVSRIDLTGNFVGITRLDLYDREKNRVGDGHQVVVFPTFVFGVPNRPRCPGQSGTTDDLLELCATIIEKVTRYNRRKFTSDEIWYIASYFIVEKDDLLVPGTQEGVDEYTRLYGESLPGAAGLLINADPVPFFPEVS